MGALALVCACAPAAFVAGCVGSGVSRQELPAAPIAFRYLTPEEARRRAEDLADGARREAETGPARARRRRDGRNDLVAKADDVGELLSGLFGGGGSAGRDSGGRLALLDPATLEIEVVPSALRGSVPLAWSSDHQRLLFAQPGEAEFQIYEYDHGERTSRRLTSGPFSHTQACYGPEDRIVVARVDPRRRPMLSFIAVSEPGGRGPYTRVSQGDSDHTPACAPDGRAIAFVREAGPARSEILVKTPVVAGSERRLAPGLHPTFSPDGATRKKREQRLARVRLDGTGRAPLGTGPRTEARPTVSPDGRFVVYVASEERLRRHLYLRRFDGSGDRILFSDGDGEFPVW
jgi:Tol biopolymer transport system component